MSVALVKVMIKVMVMTSVVVAVNALVLNGRDDGDDRDGRYG